MTPATSISTATTAVILAIRYHFATDPMYPVTFSHIPATDVPFMCGKSGRASCRFLVFPSHFSNYISICCVFGAPSSQVKSSPARHWRDRFTAQAQWSGQARSGLHASGEPVLRRRRKKHNMYTTAIHMWQKLTNELICGCPQRRPEPLPSTIQDLRTCNTHEVLIPRYVVDGPHDEYRKDATTTNVEPTDV